MSTSGESPRNFALIGAGGYIAPRHLKAIGDTGNSLVAALDPNDSVGVLDRYSFDVSFFTEFERFDRFAEKLRRKGEEQRLHWVSICSPNYLHDAHIRFALRIHANAICEKPLVLEPWNLEALRELEAENGCCVKTVLQLRVHPQLIALRQRLMTESPACRRQVELTYITSRGRWYHVSWKGQQDRSGGLATNIGIHLFDLLMWLFGPVQTVEVHHSSAGRVAGWFELERADVRWYLSIDRSDLPHEALLSAKTTYRSIKVDGSEVEFSEGFGELHTEIYKASLAGQGFGLDDARPAIQLAHVIRYSQPAPVLEHHHPLLRS
jgi:UDP-N-acetyl-2-amino-2-deoxyglucuronate dehydrogenase